MTLSMTRNGTFHVNPFAHRDNNCGLENTQLLHYRVELEIDARHLDKESGFIIDNNAVHDYFERTYKNVQKFVSCERIAMAACKHFHHNIKSLRKIDVSISGNPEFAWLKSSWAA